MNDTLGRVWYLAEKQHGAIARWQMRDRLRLATGQIRVVTRSLHRIHRGVYAIRDLDELGWYMAAVLALGPAAVLSHLSALILLGLRPYQPHRIHVSVPGRGGRERRGDIDVHRPLAPMETGHVHAIPVTSPAQSISDADLAPFELYRALEEADRCGYRTSLPLNDVVRLKRAVKGTTRSDAEAQFLILCQQHEITLPLVNHRLNGILTDFHWARARTRDRRVGVPQGAHSVRGGPAPEPRSRRRGLAGVARQ